MCLYYSQTATDKLRKSLGRGKRVFYKVLLPQNRLHFSIFYRAEWRKNKTVVSDRKDIEITWFERNMGGIREGIHVYRTKRAAMQSYLKSDSKVVCKVECSGADLIACNKYEAAFMKAKFLGRV